MAKIDKNELTKEQIEKAIACKTADELLSLAQAEGYEMTKDEAEAYIAEMADYELDDETLKSAAGGETCWTLKCHKHKKPCLRFCSIAEA
jgi:predicted ribosomally synthesized peptide with nif11-like leader